MTGTREGVNMLITWLIVTADCIRSPYVIGPEMEVEGKEGRGGEERDTAALRREASQLA